MSQLTSDLERFYSLLKTLAASPSQGDVLGSCHGKSCRWPSRGVYFFLEPGEHRHADPSASRVVRVGTHAVGVGAKSTLWGRLRAHRGSRDGRGNHRGSIFRLHVGAAILRANQLELQTWGVGGRAAREIKQREVDHEHRVSAYLNKMRVLWIAVPDEPGPRSERSFVERNAIALLSNQLKPIDPPSAGWLGLRSPRPEIAASGLWNLDYVDENYNPAFLDTFERLVTETSQL